MCTSTPGLPAACNYSQQTARSLIMLGYKKEAASCAQKEACQFSTDSQLAFFYGSSIFSLPGKNVLRLVCVCFFSSYHSILHQKEFSYWSFSKVPIFLHLFFCLIFSLWPEIGNMVHEFGSILEAKYSKWAKKVSVITFSLTSWRNGLQSPKFYKVNFSKDQVARQRNSPQKYCHCCLCPLCWCKVL